MSRFRQQQRDVPALNMAAMPDLIFTVLFFFMLVTHMRDFKPQVRYNVPQGTQLEKTARRSNVIYLFIGKPVDAQGRVLSDEPRIQLNDRFVTIADIGREVSHERSQMSESDRQHMVVSIRADRDVKMGLVNDVKQQLRQVGALHVNYAAKITKNKESL